MIIMLLHNFQYNCNGITYFPAYIFITLVSHLRWVGSDTVCGHSIVI